MTRTPNGIRTRAATLKGRRYSRFEVGKDTGQTPILGIETPRVHVSGALWALTKKLEKCQFVYRSSVSLVTYAARQFLPQLSKF
jgi:hypothetical protein